jgi:hypothetical protein
MKPPKRHHTVPKQYLKVFSNEKDQVVVFDKVKGGTYTANIADVCVEKNFYDPTELMVMVCSNSQLEEVCNAYVETKLLGVFDNDLKNALSDFIDCSHCFFDYTETADQLA